MKAARVGSRCRRSFRNSVIWEVLIIKKQVQHDAMCGADGGGGEKGRKRGAEDWWAIDFECEARVRVRDVVDEDVAVAASIEAGC